MVPGMEQGLLTASRLRPARNGLETAQDGDSKGTSALWPESGSPKVRVLLVARSLKRLRGIPKSLSRLSAALCRDRIALTVVSMEPVDEQSIQAFATGGTPVVTLGSGRGRQMLMLWRLMKACRPHVVCCTSFRGYVMVKLLQSICRFRAIYWLRGMPVMDGPMKQLTYRLISWRDTLLFNSRATMAMHARAWHKGSRRVIYNGVTDTASLALDAAGRNCAKSGLSCPPQVVLIGYTASFAEWKDHETLFRAVHQLRQTRAQLRVVLFGDGEPEAVDRLRRAASALGDAIIWAGRRTDVRELLPALDVYVHPSIKEAFGNAVVEAMMAGLPIVAARAGALPELLEDGISGLLFDPRNADDLASKITTLMDDPDFCRRLGMAARTRAVREFSIMQHAKAFEDVVLEEARCLNAGAATYGQQPKPGRTVRAGR